MHANRRIERLASAETMFLTDGGLETAMIFHEGHELPLFASFHLLESGKGRADVERYFDRYLAIAEAGGHGFVLDTCTWRTSASWGAQVGRSPEQMARLNRDAVLLAKGIRARWQDRVGPIVVNGAIGPAGDGYVADRQLTPEAAEAHHEEQVKTFAVAGCDMVSAITMTHPGEAIGIVRAAQAAGIPVVVSFTVETDGRLPTGETLGEAIAAVDAATGAAPLYFMVNCAHPDHFRDAVSGGQTWLQRIGGVRANASRMSHAELDAADELDEGDPTEFGALHGELMRLLPRLKVLGGCCGTDHRHVGCVADHLHGARAA